MATTNATLGTTACLWRGRPRIGSGMLTVILGIWLCAGSGHGFAQTPSGGPTAGGPNSATPFSQTYRRPALSPYNQISNYAQNPQLFQNVYQQMVMPQMEQQQQLIQQMQQSRQLGRLQNQVQQIQRDTSARQIDETIRPTGHRTTFQNYSHFYPMAR